MSTKINMGGNNVFTNTAGILFADNTEQSTTSSGPGAFVGVTENRPGGTIGRVTFCNIDLLTGFNFPDGSIYGGPGFSAPVGSLYVMNNSSEPKFAIYQKTGSGDTDWTILCDSGV